MEGDPNTSTGEPFYPGSRPGHVPTQLRKTIRQQCEAREDAERVLQGILEKQERETARANAAEAEVRTAKARAVAAEARARAAETRLNAIEEDFKHMREEMDALKRHP